MAQVIRFGRPRRLQLWPRRLRVLPRAISVYLAVCLTLNPGFSSSAADASLEYAVKANYLLRFTQFIEWPQQALGRPESSFNICILGNNPFGNILDQVVAGEAVYGRKVTVQRIDLEPAPGTCQILFFGDPDPSARTLAAQGRGALTVGEGENFVRNGGMIGFVIENRRVTFDINLRAAEAAGLRLRSGLLAVAKSVEK